eukprot:TRINITY_DN20273_c0_g1_i1.p1 TRINITY_DN20273_c0_g1~~TRINITY_DN20273_c0_g1_i1.p1  ORF type:complete len:169 (+),score=22.62 TRINITY_DN20273_c0_g1_i1:44-508(+)
MISPRVGDYEWDNKAYEDHIRVERLCDESGVRAGELSRLAEKARSIAQQVEEVNQIGSQRRVRRSLSPSRSTSASAPSVFSPGSRVRAVADLSVRGCVVITTNTPGTIFGLSDDPNLPTGLNVEFDYRHDNSTRRINVSLDDIEPFTAYTTTSY